MRHMSRSLSIFALLIAFALLTAQGFCGPAKATTMVGQVNINTATQDELCLLPRIGEKVAQRIIEYRTVNGPFKSTADLKNVKGIGDKTYEKLAGMVKISGTTDLRITDGR